MILLYKWVKQRINKKEEKRTTLNPVLLFLEGINGVKKHLQLLFKKDEKWKDKTIFSWTLIWNDIIHTWWMVLPFITMPITFLGFSFWGVNLIEKNIAPETYYTIVHYMVYTAPILFSIVGIILPIALLTRPINNGSLAIQLVSSNSRNKILINKLITIWIFMIVILIFQTSFGTLIFELEAPKGYVGKFINMNSCYWLGTAVLSFITFAFTTVFKKSRMIFSFSITILFISIVLPLVGSVTGTSVLTYISIYGFYRDNLVRNNSPLIVISYLIGILIVFVLSTYSVKTFNIRNLEL